MPNKKGSGKRTGTGAEKQQRKQERIEQRRKERAAAAIAAHRRARRDRLVRWVFLAAAMLFALWFFFLRIQTPDEILGHEIEKFGVGPANQHTTETVNYPMTPPVGGRHAPGAAACGVHATKIPDENMVHSLEHGAVGLLYDPQAAAEPDIRALEAMVGDYDRNVFSAPYPGMETPIAVVSWGEMMRLDRLDEEAVLEYIEVFRGKGPEPGQECLITVDQPFPTPGPTFDVNPTETPAPDDQPEGESPAPDATE